MSIFSSVKSTKIRHIYISTVKLFSFYFFRFSFFSISLSSNRIQHCCFFFFSLRTELSAKHAKHIADLKLYYESEINELKSQLNRIKMGLNLFLFFYF
jgi:hypothetical protein